MFFLIIVEYEDDLSFSDNRVKFFWEAMNNFTNDERSKFVRFVTGRKRFVLKKRVRNRFRI